MPLTEDDRDLVEAFRMFVEDTIANDDRYGPLTRSDREDESILVSWFEAGPGCWLEVAVHPTVPRVCIGFLTDDRSTSEGIKEAIQESDQSLRDFVVAGLREAGLDWTDPPVEHNDNNGDGPFHFTTPVDIEEIPDLERDENRSRVLRLLEGYLIAFGEAIMLEEE